jgi:hypothetical protein
MSASTFFRERVVRPLEENSKWLGSLAALVSVSAVALLAARWLFAAPDVAVTVRQNQLAFPPKIVQPFQKSLPRAKLLALAGADSAFSPLIALDDFTRDTKDFVAVDIANNSGRTLLNVDIRVKGVHRLTGYSLTGDLLQSVEQKQISDSTRFDAESGLLTVGAIRRFPPSTNLRIFVWGDAGLLDVLGADPVSVVYDGGTGVLIRHAEVQGNNAFVYENGALLFVLIVVVNSAVLALRHQTRTQAEPSTAPSSEV